MQISLSWTKVCILIFETWMRVRNLLMFNQALLRKWMWRYVHERGALWRMAVILNMVALGVGGILMRFMGRMGWDFGRISRGVGWSFLATLDLRRGLVPKFNSSMMFIVGIKLSRHLFWICTALLVLRMLLWQTIWSFLVPLINEILIFS